MTDSYQSISGESTGAFRDKASKFLSFAFPVETEEEAREKLANLRNAYHDANHHCFAYRLGPEGTVFRVSDDGEPSGSAGRPILGQMVSMGISDIMVVVVRYFGGTKLGIPGLIHAYKTSARLSLENASLTEKYVESRILATFPYQDLDAVMRILKQGGVRTIRKQIDQLCTAELMVRRSLHDSLIERLCKASKTLKVTGD